LRGKPNCILGISLGESNYILLGISRGLKYKEPNYILEISWG
jgi:hypothetical protein